MTLWLILWAHLSLGVRPLFLPSIGGVHDARQSWSNGVQWNHAIRQKQLEQPVGALIQISRRF